MAYRTITDESGDEFRFFYFKNADGQDVARVEYRRAGYPDFELLYEGIVMYVIPQQFPEFFPAPRVI